MQRFPMWDGKYYRDDKHVFQKIGEDYRIFDGDRVQTESQWDVYQLQSDRWRSGYLLTHGTQIGDRAKSRQSD